MCMIYCRIKYLEGTMSLIRLWSNVCEYNITPSEHSHKIYASVTMASVTMEPCLVTRHS